MNVARPLCSVCFRNAREPGSARCADCGPGRLYGTTRPRPVMPPARDALELDAQEQQ